MQFNAAKDLCERDMGSYADATMKLREANQRGDRVASCRSADLIVISLGSAQVQLEKIISLIEAAHQNTSRYQADYQDNATPFALRKAPYDKSGCFSGH